MADQENGTGEKVNDDPPAPAAALKSGETPVSNERKRVSFSVPDEETGKKEADEAFKRVRSGSLADMSAFLNSFKEFQSNLNETLKDGAHINTNITGARHTLAADGDDKPSKYVEETNLERNKKIERTRLALRLHQIDFPLDASMQALKLEDNDISKAVKALLKWFPKGEGGKKMAQNLTNRIVRAEKQLTALRKQMKRTFETGSLVRQLEMLWKTYKDHDKGDKEYLTPEEFGSLTHSLGVTLSSTELAEIIVKLDENEDGEIQFEEFLEWWSNDEITKLYEDNIHNLKALFRADDSDADDSGEDSDSDDKTQKAKSFANLTVDTGHSSPKANGKKKLPPLEKSPSVRFSAKLHSSPQYVGRRKTFGPDESENSAAASRIASLLDAFDNHRRNNLLEALSPTTAVNVVKKKLSMQLNN